MPITALQKPVKISPALAKITGSNPIPRSEVTKKVWAYIKQHSLQDPDKKTSIKPDATLKAVLGGREVVHMMEMPALINKHLTKIEAPVAKPAKPAM